MRVLALSGGGYLGYYTALVLAGLDERAGVPLGRRFDLIAGTSIGGMTALAVAGEVPMRRVAAAFAEKGAGIFSVHPKRRGLLSNLSALAGSAFRPRYEARRLRAAFLDILDDIALGALKHKVLVPAVDAATGEARLFRSWREEDRGLSAIDVAIATAAVPTFYEQAPVGGGHYVDGGLYANAPDMLAFVETQGCDVEMVSVGTTTGRFLLPAEKAGGMGTVDWLMEERMVRLTIAGQQSATVKAMETLLGERYLRIDRAQTEAEQAVLGLDVATPQAQAILRRMAEQSLAAVEGNGLLERILVG